jgi:hypothetical protein
VVFILITNFQTFIQQHAADALADLCECHRRYAFFDSATRPSGTTTSTNLTQALRFVGMPNAIAANMRQIIYGGILIYIMFRYSKGFESRNASTESIRKNENMA